MYITLETDYAIRILDVLARKADGKNRYDAKTLIALTGVPNRFALKILHKLVENSILVSFKGVYGGYELAISPAELSLLDVVELVEGTYQFSRCLDEDYACPRKTDECCAKSKGLPCTYKAAFKRISTEVSQMLKNETFDKLI